MTKTRKTRCLLFLFAVMTVWLFAASWFPRQASTQSRDEKSIAREIVYAYCWDQDLSSKRLRNLLEELEDVSPESANKWREILSCWKDASSDMPLHYGAVPDDLGDGLCLIVLGFQLNPDGTMQKELINRLEAALESAERYPDAYLLCTGGGTAQNANITEAEAMARWLTEQGISEDRIILENQSLTTTQNAVFSSQILARDYPQITKAALVSSDYHLPWATILFQTQFILEELPLTVVSNAACHASETISKTTLLYYQSNGILEIAHLNKRKDGNSSLVIR